MTNANSLSKPNRVELVDALRGFALLGIILIHNVEHFDIANRIISDSPVWGAVDRFVWDAVFFLFGGKCYAIFALMFGFSFYVQFENRKKRNEPFAGRFFWRMCILLLFGFFHVMFYSGEILSCYALCGMLIIPLRNLSNKVLTILMIFFALQPYDIAQLVIGLVDPDFVPLKYDARHYFVAIEAAKESDSFFHLARLNLTQGMTAAHLFAWFGGRYLQTLALFLAGILLGRKGLFTEEKAKGAFWKKVWIIGVLCFIPLYVFRLNFGSCGFAPSIAGPLWLLVKMWGNLAFAALLVSFFVLLWYYTRFGRIEAKLVPYGKMSMTNYICSSILGSMIYYHYGLGLYDKAGPMISLLIGIGIFILQLLFSRWWSSRYRRGPVETLWYKLTYLK